MAAPKAAALPLGDSPSIDFDLMIRCKSPAHFTVETLLKSYFADEIHSKQMFFDKFQLLKNSFFIFVTINCLCALGPKPAGTQ